MIGFRKPGRACGVHATPTLGAKLFLSRLNDWVPALYCWNTVWVPGWTPGWNTLQESVPLMPDTPQMLGMST